MLREVRRHHGELLLRADELGDDEELFPMKAIRQCIKEAPAAEVLGAD